MEDSILHHPAVADAAVMGITDEDRGELPMAWVVLKHGSSATEKDIVEFVAGN